MNNFNVNAEISFAEPTGSPEAISTTRTMLEGAMMCRERTRAALVFSIREDARAAWRAYSISRALASELRKAYFAKSEMTLGRATERIDEIADAWDAAEDAFDAWYSEEKKANALLEEFNKSNRRFQLFAGKDEQ